MTSIRNIDHDEHRMPVAECLWCERATAWRTVSVLAIASAGPPGAAQYELAILRWVTLDVQCALREMCEYLEEQGVPGAANWPDDLHPGDVVRRFIGPGWASYLALHLVRR